MLDEPQRVGVGPLEVVDHEHDRPARAGEGVGHRSVDPEPFVTVAAAGLSRGIEQCVDRFGIDSPLAQVAGQLRDRPERRHRSALRGASPGGDEPHDAGRVHGPLGEPRLADSRLADEQDGAAAPAGRVGDGVRQGAELAVTPHEG